MSAAQPLPTNNSSSAGNRRCDLMMPEGRLAALGATTSFGDATPGKRAKRPRATARAPSQQAVVKVQLHSAGAASRLAALLLAQILPVFSLVAPCQPGASPPSVQRPTFTPGCLARHGLSPARARS